MVVAKVRSRMAARLTTRAVRLLSSLPPLILLPGQSPSQAQKAFALGQQLMSTPISDIRISTLNTFNPTIRVKSIPQMRVSAAVKSCLGALPLRCFLTRFFLNLEQPSGWLAAALALRLD